MAGLGNSYEETIALVTGGTEILANQSSKVARGLRTIGNNIADTANKTGKLSYEVQGTAKSLSLLDETGDILSTFDVMKGIAEDWDKMSSAEQQALAISLSGKNQFEVFMATLNNFDAVLSASETALMSYGSAAKENAKYLDSIEGAVAGFQSSFQELANNLISSDVVKGVVNFGTALLDIANTDFGQVTTGVLALVAAWRGLVFLAQDTKIGQFIANDFSQIISPLKKASSAFKTGMGTALKNTSTEASSLRVVLNGLKGGFSGLVGAINPLIGVFAAVTAGAGLFYYTLTYNSRELENQKATVSSLVGELDNLETQLEELKGSGGSGTQYEAELRYLEGQIAAQEKLVQIQAKKQYDMQFGAATQTVAYRSATGETVYEEGTSKADKLKKAVADIDNVYGQIVAKNQQIAALDKDSVTYQEDLNTLMNERNGLTDEYESLFNKNIEDFQDYYDLYHQMGDLATEDMKEVNDSILRVVGNYGQMDGALQTVEQTLGSIVKNAIDAEDQITTLASDSLAALQETLGQPADDAAFQGYAEIWKNTIDLIDKGKTNTKEFWAAAEAYLGSEELAKLGYDVDAIAAKLKAMSPVFKDSESAAKGFFDLIKADVKETGAIYDDFGNKILEAKQNAEGEWMIDIDSSRIQELGEKYGFTTEMIAAFLEALRAQSGINLTYDLETFTNAVDELGIVAERSGKKVVSLEKWTEATDGLDGQKIANYYRAMEEAGYVFLDTSADAAELAGNLVELDAAIQNSDGTISIDYTDVVELLGALGKSEDEIIETLDNLSKESTIDINWEVGDTGNIEAVQGILANVEKSSGEAKQSLADVLEQEGLVTSASDTLKKTVQEALGIENSTTSGSLETTAQSAENATKKVAELIAGLTNIPKFVTTTVNVLVNQQEMAIGTKGKNASAAAAKFYNSRKTGPGGVNTMDMLLAARAKGDTWFRGGETLVGDEWSPTGEPRPEMVIADGQAYIVGKNGPEIRNIPKGAQILPYEDTMKVLNGKNITSKKIPAYDSGTSYSITSKSRSVTAANASSSAAKNIQEENEKIKEQNELFKEEIEILEHELFLRQKNGASAEELEEMMLAIQKRLHEQADWYRSQGLDDTHEYIRETQTDWWNYMDDIESLWEDTLNNMKDELDESLDISEHQIFLLEKQDNTEQQRIAIYRKAQEDLHALAEKYRAMGLDENSELIRELQKQWWEYQDEIEAVYDEILAIIEEKTNNLTTTFDYMVKQIDREIENLEAEIDRVNDQYDQELEDLEKANDELEKRKELEEALKNLEEARNKKNLVYKNGYFQYIEDVDAISEATEKLEEIEKENALQAAKDDIERRRQEALKDLEEDLEKMEDYKEAWSSVVDNYEEEQARLIAEQVLGIKLEGDNWKTRLDNLQEYVSQYNQLMDDIKNEAYKDDDYIQDLINPNAVDVAVKKGGSAPAGLNVGDRVHTEGGTFQITKVNSDGSYESFKVNDDKYTGAHSTDDNYVYLNKDGTPVSTTGSSDYNDGISWDNGNQSSTNASNTTVAVMEGGSAPPGLPIGTKIATGGGTWRITGTNPDGSYISEKVDDRKYTGQMSTKDNIVYLPNYARGTENAPGGLSIVGEEGPEIRMLNSGDAIFPHNVSKNLMSWGTLDPSAFFKMMDKDTGTTQNVRIDNINLPNVSDAQQFVQELKNFTTHAIQYGGA